IPVQAAQPLARRASGEKHAQIGRVQLRPLAIIALAEQAEVAVRHRRRVPRGAQEAFQTVHTEPAAGIGEERAEARRRAAQRAGQACGGPSPATAMLATTADESRPPDRNAATGTSLTRWAATESSSHSTRRSAMSGGAGVSCRGRSQ